MYSIGHVIFGIPKTQAISEKISEWEADEECEKWYEDNGGCCGFETMYSGSAEHEPGFCGVELETFDECCDFLRVREMKLEPTEEQKQEALEKIGKLEPELREIGPDPDV